MIGHGSRRRLLIVLLLLILLVTSLRFLRPMHHYANLVYSTTTTDYRTTIADCPLLQEQTAIQNSNCPPELLREQANCSAAELFPELMRERQRLLRERCENAAWKKGTAMEKFYLNKVGSKGILWCPIYKGASSSTIFHFCPLYYGQSVCESNPSATIFRKPDFKGSRAPKNTPTLLIVRHPFERLFSAYRDKIQAPRSKTVFIRSAMEEASFIYRLIPPETLQKREQLQQSALVAAKKQMQEHPVERGQYVYVEGSDNPYLNPISATFEEFIRAVLTGKFVNPHWRQVDQYCAPCSEHYDYILKVENYQCEFPQFLKTLGSTESLLNRIDFEKRVNVNNGRSVTDRTDFYQYFAALPDNLLDALHKWYKADCELLDYNCEKTLCEIREWRRNNL